MMTETTTGKIMKLLFVADNDTEDNKDDDDDVGDIYKYRVFSQ